MENSDKLGEHGKKTVGELGFGRIEIVSVKPELSAIEALKVRHLIKNLNESLIVIIGPE